MKTWLGVEIGGTKQQIGVISDGGEILEIISERVVLKRGAEDILDWMKGKIPPLFEKYSFSGVGVGFGGVLDTKKGASICSVQVPGWKDFPIKAWFEKEFSLPCTVVNDTVCGGYAELILGSGKGKRVFAYTNIGTGCGGSIFINGKSFDGIGIGGAYFGQIYVPDRKTGKTARMESVCSGSAVKNKLQSEGYIPKESSLYKIKDTASFIDLCREARCGDEFANKELDEWAESYSYAMANILCTLSPERISLGGGAANDSDLLIPLIKKHTDRLVFLSAEGRYNIVPCHFLDNAVFVGAALYARDGFENNLI